MEETDIMISIIVPYYKTLELTKELLARLMPQLTKETQLIVVDDGCNEMALYDFMVEQDTKNGCKGFEYCKKPNGGVSSARNRGIDLSSGKYLAFIDSDDMVREDYIKTILREIDTAYPIYKLSWESVGINEAYYDAENLPDWNVAVWARIFRRDIVKHLFDETKKACEDKQFLVDNGIVIDHGLWVEDTGRFEYGYISEPIYIYNSGRVGSLSNLYL